MEDKEFNKIKSSIEEKLGTENVAIIADDLGQLIAHNSNLNNKIETQNNDITKLQNDKEKLIITNGNLLQQVSMNEPTLPNKPEIEEKKFSFQSCFDEKGNFKK